MPTLIVGIGVVVLASAGFAVAMFGRRPLPQIATTTQRSDGDAVSPSSMEPRGAGRRRGSRATASTAPDAAPEQVEPRLHVEVPTQVRIRSVFLLGLGVIVAAGIVGVIVSIAVVGFFTVLG